MPSHMSRSFTIEFWMRPNLMNNISLTNYFFKLDFDTKNMKEFVLGPRDWKIQIVDKSLFVVLGIIHSSLATCPMLDGFTFL